MPPLAPPSDSLLS